MLVIYLHEITTTLSPKTNMKIELICTWKLHKKWIHLYIYLTKRINILKKMK